MVLTGTFYSSLPFSYIQAGVSERGIDEFIASIETGTNKVDDHNWNRKKIRFCVQKLGDVSVLYYYREKETGDIKQPSILVVATKDLWETLVGVHRQLWERTRIEKYLVEYGSRIPRPVIQLFLNGSLSDLSGY